MSVILPAGPVGNDRISVSPMSTSAVGPPTVSWPSDLLPGRGFAAQTSEKYSISGQPTRRCVFGAGRQPTDRRYFWNRQVTIVVAPSYSDVVGSTPPEPATRFSSTPRN